MRQLKFSHHYKKMPAVLRPTFLRELQLVEYKDLTPEEIKYDTETTDGQFYELPKTRLIRLILWTEGNQWQTLRRWTPGKWDYYEGLIGQELEIVIEEK